MTTNHMPGRIRGLLGAAGAAAVLAIGSAPAISASAATVHHTTVRHQAVTAADADNGKTITVRSGGRVTLKLASTYWTVRGSSDPKVLHQLGKTSTQPAKPGACVPGQGCGTVTATFVAMHRGTADVTATRTTCGEAMLCSPAQGSYVIHVVVAG